MDLCTDISRECCNCDQGQASGCPCGRLPLLLPIPLYGYDSLSGCNGIRALAAVAAHLCPGTGSGTGNHFP